MSSFTKNYNFIQPGNEDYYDVQDFNENMEAIDTQLAATEKGVEQLGKEVKQGLSGIAATLGTPPHGQTLTSLLQNGGSVVRSVQHLVYVPADSRAGSATIPIQPVNPAKTIVFSERLININPTPVNYDYTLNSNAIVITHTVCQDVTIFKVGFWVLEFV